LLDKNPLSAVACERKGRCDSLKERGRGCIVFNVTYVDRLHPSPTREVSQYNVRRNREGGRNKIAAEATVFATKWLLYLKGERKKVVVRPLEGKG